MSVKITKRGLDIMKLLEWSMIFWWLLKQVSDMEAQYNPRIHQIKLSNWKRCNKRNNRKPKTKRIKHGKEGDHILRNKCKISNLKTINLMQMKNLKLQATTKPLKKKNKRRKMKSKRKSWKKKRMKDLKSSKYRKKTNL